MAFIKKNWRRDIGDNSINAAARISGAGLAAYTINKFQTIEGALQGNMQKTLAIMGAPGLTIVGLLGDLFVENPIVRSFCQGLYTYAAPRTIANMNDDLADAFGWKHAPQFADNTGTAGIGAPIMNGTPAIMNGVPPIMNGISPSAYQQVANTVRQSAPQTDGEVKGLAESMLLNN